MAEQAYEDQQSDCEQPALRSARFRNAGAAVGGLSVGWWRRRKHRRHAVLHPALSVAAGTRNRFLRVRVLRDLDAPTSFLHTRTVTGWTCDAHGGSPD